MNPEMGHHPQEAAKTQQDDAELGIPREATDQEHMPEVVKHLTPYDDAKLVDLVYENPHSLDKLPKDELQKRVTGYEAMPEYKEYLNLHLNFDRMDEGLARFKMEGGGEHEELADRLRSAIDKVKLDVSKYYQVVMQWDRTKIQSFRLEPDEYKEEMVRVDQRRSAIHNSLIDSITAMARLTYREIPQATGFKFDKSELFDAGTIQDVRSPEKGLHQSGRERIATWAFINERGAHISMARRVAKVLMENKKGPSKR